MSKLGSRITLGLALACLLPSSFAQAAEQKGSGTVTYVPVVSGASELADGRTVVRSGSKGIILSDDESIPFHLAGESCGGTTIISADGTRTWGSGYCDAIDKDGDAWWIWWRIEGDGSTWGFLEGTGKYEGITGGGTTKTLVRLPDGRQTIHWEGTWQVK